MLILMLNSRAQLETFLNFRDLKQTKKLGLNKI